MGGTNQSHLTMDSYRNSAFEGHFHRMVEQVGSDGSELSEKCPSARDVILHGAIKK